MSALELLLRRDGERVLLCSPGVGLFTESLAPGEVATAGAALGTLIVLGRAFALVAPGGAEGRIVSARPERVHEPVGYGTELYELAPLALGGQGASGGERGSNADAHAAGPVLRAPYAGRFWSRPSPGEPAFVEPGALVEEGYRVGLIEVMKTFAHVYYSAGATGRGSALPPRARVVRILAADGAELQQGDPLLEVAPA